MSAATSAKSQSGSGLSDVHAVSRALREAVLDAIWRQWSVLGVSAAAAKASAVVDPEALVLASLWLQKDEPRLQEILTAWASSNSMMLSVQRMKNMSAVFPSDVGDGLSAFARTARESGKDLRWKSLENSRVPALVGRPGKTLVAALPLLEPRAVLLRLRSLLGVGMRADIIAFLRCQSEDFVAPDDIADAVVYNPSAVRRLLDALVEAEGIGDAGGPYPGYGVRKHHPFGRFLGPSEIGPWAYCADVFAFVTAYLKWYESARTRSVTDFALSVKGDALFESHRRAFVETGIVPRHRQAGFGDNFLTHLRGMTEYISSHI